MTYSAIYSTAARCAVLCGLLLAACSKHGSGGEAPVTAAGTGGAAPQGGSAPSKPDAGPVVAGMPASGAGGGAPASATRAPIAGAPAPAAGTGSAGAAGGGNAGAAGGGNAGAPATLDPPSNTWRMMGYDHRNWYLNPAETSISVDNASMLTELWRFKVSGFPVGSPVIADGKVFAIASGGLYAIDLMSGKQVWFREDIAGSASVAYDDGFIYVQNSLPARVYKLKAATGDTVWGPVLNCDDESSCSGESSPIIAGGSVFVGLENNMVEAGLAASSDTTGKRGGVTALDAATGTLRWRYRTIPDGDVSRENGASVWSTVSVDLASATVFATTGNNYTIAGPNGEAFHALDLMTGAKRWVSQVRQGDIWTNIDGDNQNDMDFGANPILAEIDGRPLVAAGDKGGAFWAVDRATGKVVWSRDDLAPSHSAVFGGVFINGAFDGRAFYVVSNDSGRGAVLHRLDARDGKTSWKHAFRETTWGASSLANGVLFVPNNATLYVMNADTGDLLTQFDTGGTIAGGAAAIAQGRVVVKSGLLWGDLAASKANDQIICYGLPAAASGGATGAAGSAATPRTAGFTAIHREVFVGAGCTSGLCHSAAAAGGLDLSAKDAAYRNLVGVRAMGADCAGSGLLRVAPRDAAASLLVQKLEHTQTCGAPMPSATSKLPAAQLEQVRAWIASGAAND